MMRDLFQECNDSDYLSEIFFDRDTKFILESTRDLTKSANQIILECNLSQSTGYRKLKRLAQLKLLRIKYVMGEYGRWEMRYQSNLCLLRGPSLLSKQNI
ncbi:MAG: hypothetical protein ACREA3_06535 [Nitrosotalea sp.]